MTNQSIDSFQTGKSKIDWFKTFSNQTEHGSGLDPFYYRQLVGDMWNHYYCGFGNFIDEVESAIEQQLQSDEVNIDLHIPHFDLVLKAIGFGTS